MASSDHVFLFGENLALKCFTKVENEPIFLQGKCQGGSKAFNPSRLYTVRAHMAYVYLTQFNKHVPNKQQHVIIWKLFRTNNFYHIYFFFQNIFSKLLNIKHCAIMNVRCFTDYYRIYNIWSTLPHLKTYLAHFYYVLDETRALSGGTVASRSNLITAWTAWKGFIFLYSSIRRYIADMRTHSSLPSFVSPAATGLSYHHWVTIVTASYITCSSGLIAAV